MIGLYDLCRRWPLKIAGGARYLAVILMVLGGALMIADKILPASVVRPR